MSTEQSNRVMVKSYAGYPKPISPAQIEALVVVVAGAVFYKPYFDRVIGVRRDTYDVLRRNELVEVLDECENPDQRARSHRHRVRLTDAGYSALEHCRS